MEQLTFIRVDQQPEWRPRVKDLPLRERPVNRLRDVGPMAVSTAELLACLLQTGDALHQAQELLVRFEGLPGLIWESLPHIPHFAWRYEGPVAAILFLGAWPIALWIRRRSDELLEEARREAIERMKEQAQSVGANAIVNVRFSTSSVAQGAAELFAYGTAVKVQ